MRNAKLPRIGWTHSGATAMGTLWAPLSPHRPRRAGGWVTVGLGTRKKIINAWVIARCSRVRCGGGWGSAQPRAITDGGPAGPGQVGPARQTAPGRHPPFLGRLFPPGAYVPPPPPPRLPSALREPPVPLSAAPPRRRQRPLPAPQHVTPREGGRGGGRARCTCQSARHFRQLPPLPLRDRHPPTPPARRGAAGATERLWGRTAPGSAARRRRGRRRAREEEACEESGAARRGPRRPPG